MTSRWRSAGVSRFGWSVARTSACNVGAAAAAGIAGVVIARSLGPAARGEYAAILAWFGVVLVAGQLGQTAATTYHVARERSRAARYVATSRNLMVASGAVTLAIGMLAAPLLASATDAPTTGYLLMFATCLASFVGASYTFSLQAADLPRWNLARLLQPVAYVVLITGAQLAGWLDLMTALALVTITTAAQAAFAYWLCRGAGLTGGPADRNLTRPLVRYGLGQLASAVPNLLTNRMAVLVLSFAVAPAALGQYAVATSVTRLAVPVVAGLGGVAFPRIAARAATGAGTLRLRRWAVVTSAVAGVALMAPVALSAPWLVPLVFGESFRAAVPLVLLLTPGGVLLACGRVCGDLLRGYGRPLAVARAQVAAAVATALLLAALVPWFGVTGAAVAASAAPGVALVYLLRALHRLPAPEQSAPVPTG